MPHPAFPTPRPTRHRRNWLCFAEPLIRLIHHNPFLVKYLSRFSLRGDWLCFAESRPAPAAIPAPPCVARSCPFEANWLCFARLPPDRWQRQGLWPWRWSSLPTHGELGLFVQDATPSHLSGLGATGTAGNWLRFALHTSPELALFAQRSSADY